MAKYERLISLWASWDSTPSKDYAVQQLEDEVQRVAGELGIAGSQLRIRIVNRRHEGMDLRAAVEAATR